MADLIGKTGDTIKGLIITDLKARGPKGERGVGIASTEVNENCELVIIFTDGSTYISPSIQGPPGEYDDSELRALINDRYTKEEVDNMISAIPKFDIEVVDSLPVSQISTTTIYLLRNSGEETGNLYDEYIYTTEWEKLGTQTVDLSNYPTTDDMNAAINAAISSIVDGDEVEF